MTENDKITHTMINAISKVTFYRYSYAQLKKDQRNNMRCSLALHETINYNIILVDCHFTNLIVED